MVKIHCIAKEEDPNNQSIISARRERVSGTASWARLMPESLSGSCSLTEYSWTGCVKLLTSTDPVASARMPKIWCSIFPHAPIAASQIQHSLSISLILTCWRKGVLSYSWQTPDESFILTVPYSTISFLLKEHFFL